LKQNTKRISAV